MRLYIYPIKVIIQKQIFDMWSLPRRLKVSINKVISNIEKRVWKNR